MVVWSQCGTALFLGTGLFLLGNLPVEAQRARATGQVNFYAAPDGIDNGNDCRSQSTPCTPQGAHAVALRDWDFSGSGCTIRLAPGTYNTTVSIAGQYVGTHLCQVYGHVDKDGNCIDRTRVVFDVPAGRAAFDVQDLMMTSIACIKVQGANAIGFFGRQFVIIDLADIDCGSIGACISLTAHAGLNVARQVWISGDQTTFIQIDRHSRVTFAQGAGVAAMRAVALDYFILSYNHSMVEFVGGNEVSGAGFIAESQCIPSWMGTINANELTLPCAVKPGPDGKVY